MMRINIVYEVNNREFFNCLLLQRELLRRGYDARIYNKTETILLDDNSKSITFLPNSYRKLDLDHYRYVFNTNGGVIVVYPCEQVTNHKMPLFFDSSADNPVKRLPHLCWGKDYYDYLRNMGYINEKNTIVGAIQLDFFKKEFVKVGYTREQLAKKYFLPIEKKWILFISDFVFNSEMITEQIINGGDWPEKVVRARYSYGKKSCKVILEWFAKFLSEHKDYIVIYRKHPVEMVTDDIKEFANNNSGFYTVSALNVREWIVNSDRIVSWYSTTVVECMAAGKNMIVVRPFVLDSDSGFDEYDFYKDYYKITRYEELCDALMSEKNFITKNTRDLINDLYSIDDYPTYKRVADSIDDIIKDEKNCRCDLERWFQFKRWKYLLSRMIPMKIVIKKIFQGLYNMFGCNFHVESENKLAINEWIASANFKKNAHMYAQKIDEIIRVKD